jgi:hypothetical protein
MLQKQVLHYQNGVQDTKIPQYPPYIFYFYYKMGKNPYIMTQNPNPMWAQLVHFLTPYVWLVFDPTVPCVDLPSFLAH